MKEQPILMISPMVRGILNGIKTVTRRGVKLPDNGYHNFIFDNLYNGHGGQLVACFSSAESGQVRQEGIASPFGQVGDRLWVRETARIMQVSGKGDDRQARIMYEADGTIATVPFPPRLKPVSPGKCIPNGCHREAARLFLEITGLRVERLQDCIQEDAIAEGIERTNFTGFGDDPGVPRYPEPDVYRGNQYQDWTEDAVEAYQHLWESLAGPGSWDANPWVWVIEFKRAEKAA